MNADWKLEDQNCASCHADHQGRDHDLTRVASKRCVACHSDLTAGCSGVPSVSPNVTAFTRDSHGDFASLAVDDPGTIKFDHAQHMLPGQVDTGQRGGFTIAQLPPQDRNRYRETGQVDSDLVTLECSSCHELAGIPDDGKSLFADNELGRYLQPIGFDRHCAACHSLSPGIATEDSTPLPHAVPWRQIDLLLAANVRGAEAIGLVRRPRDDSQAVPVPGEGLGESPAATSVTTTFDVAAARALVQEKCLQCHDESAITDQSILSSRDAGSEMIPSRWLQRGLFDHAAHRNVACQYCHAAAYPNDQPSGTAVDQQKVMIAGIVSCTACHRSEELERPAELDVAETVAMIEGQPSWASDRCTLCHRYHTSHAEGFGLSNSGDPSVSGEGAR